MYSRFCRWLAGRILDFINIQWDFNWTMDDYLKRRDNCTRSFFYLSMYRALNDKDTEP